MSDIKEKIAKQLMGSKTGLLSSTLAERLTIEKSIINDALEEMRQIQDVKKGSKSGLDNYRWTMTDMGRLNYRVDESLLTQTKKTTIETPQAAPIVEESPLAQKQVATSNVAESTVEFEFTNADIADLYHKLCEDYDKLQTEIEQLKSQKTNAMLGKNMFDWSDGEIVNFAIELVGESSANLQEVIDNLQSMFKAMRRDFDKAKSSLGTKEIAVGLSDEQVRRYALSHSQNEVHAESIVMQFKAWQKTQTFLQPEDRDDYEQLWKNNKALASQLRKAQQELEQLKSQQFTPNWDDAPKVAVTASCVWRFYDNKGFVVHETREPVEQRQKTTPIVDISKPYRNKITGVKFIVESIEQLFVDDNTQYVNYRSDKSGRMFLLSISDFLAKFERVGGGECNKN